MRVRVNAEVVVELGISGGRWMMKVKHQGHRWWGGRWHSWCRGPAKLSPKVIWLHAIKTLYFAWFFAPNNLNKQGMTTNLRSEQCKRTLRLHNVDKVECLGRMGGYTGDMNESVPECPGQNRVG